MNLKFGLKRTLIAAALVSASINLTLGQGLDAAVQTKVDAITKQAQTWAADPVIVNAVKAYNNAPPADSAAMTQDKWKTLPILDPFVRSFSKNPAGESLKSKKTDTVSEAFLSGADGNKVAFLAKTTGWCHKGKPKHDVPMTNKTWQGSAEMDESTGLQEVQVAVPVLDAGTPIGSLVVGISLSHLAKE
jgi:hypothetical protein